VLLLGRLVVDPLHLSVLLAQHIAQHTTLQYLQGILGRLIVEHIAQQGLILRKHLLG
jgi:hypothetical protein